jgi:hypothetical protein
MIRVEFSPEIIDALDHERYHHPSPAVQRKMEALYLKSTGMPPQGDLSNLPDLEDHSCSLSEAISR